MATGAAKQPRVLLLAPDDRVVVIKRLARAVLRFQDSFLHREGSPAGLLCQVWLPEITGESELVLKTKGMPFCVAGLGDLLALFRCISCRFAFGTDVKKVAQLGAPGRVFTSSEPELTCNVQRYSKTAYLRKAEAEQCQVQSTLLLPVFLSAERHGCMGVLEVVQTSEDMRFTEMAELIAKMLETCQLYTSTRESIEHQLPRGRTTTTLLLPPSVDILHATKATSEDSGDRANSTDGVPMADVDTLEQATCCSARGATSRSGQAQREEHAQARGASCQQAQHPTACTAGPQQAAAAAGGHDSTSDDEDIGAGGESGDEGEDGQGAVARPLKSEGRSQGTVMTGPRRRGKGTGNPGKPGVRLSLEDVQSQFGVGLKEAAVRLGICPTTLKRACRRHGIQRWPRRQLMKVNQALDDMEAREPLVLLQQQQQQLLLQKTQTQGTLTGGGFPGPDTRWTTLAQFIPTFQQTLQYNELPELGGMQAGMGPQGNNLLGMDGVATAHWGGNGLAGGTQGGLAGVEGIDTSGRLSAGTPGGGFQQQQLLPQFAEYQGGNWGMGFPPLGVAAAGSAQDTNSVAKGSSLPSGMFNLLTASADGSGTIGLSSYSQPVPADASAAQRLWALRHGMGPSRGQQGANGLHGLAPAGPGGALQGGMPNVPGISKSWQLSPLPSPRLGSSLEFDLSRMGALVEDQMRDDDVGFLDSTMLEMMLQKDAGRGGGVAAGGVLGSLSFR